TDRIGSVRVATDVAGASVTEFTYSAYGEDRLGALDESTRIRFAGEYWVPELGMYYLRSRFYDARAGRFLTPDRLDTRPVLPTTSSPYLYAPGNPVNVTAPLGPFSLSELSTAATIAGTLASIAIQVWPKPVVLLLQALGFDPENVSRIGLEGGFSYAFPNNPMSVSFSLASATARRDRSPRSTCISGRSSGKRSASADRRPTRDSAS